MQAASNVETSGSNEVMLLLDLPDKACCTQAPSTPQKIVHALVILDFSVCKDMHDDMAKVLISLKVNVAIFSTFLAGCRRSCVCHRGLLSVSSTCKARGVQDVHSGGLIHNESSQLHCSRHQFPKRHLCGGAWWR